MNDTIKISHHEGDMYYLLDSECNRLALPVGCSIHLSPAAIATKEAKSASVFKLIDGIYYPLPRYLQNVTIQEV